MGRTSTFEKKKQLHGCVRVVLFFMGIFALFFGFMTGGLIMAFFIAGGIMFLLLTFMPMYLGKGTCPYCGNMVDDISLKNVTYKCKHCKKISNVRENYLETIE